MATPKRKSKSVRKSGSRYIDSCCGQAAQPMEGNSRRLSPSAIVFGLIVAILVIFVGMKVLYPIQHAGPQESSVVPIAAGPDIDQASKVMPSSDDVPPRANPEPLNHTFTFDEVFARLHEADKAQDTDLRKESLIKNPVQMKKIDPLLIEARKLRDDLNRSVIDNETVYWLSLVEGRIDMLESQKYLHLALAYGREGLMSKNLTDSCARQKTILDAALLYNMSALKGGRAMYMFDDVLLQEKTWPVLGINDKKLAFYGGDTRDIGGMSFNNVEAIRVKCMGLKAGDAPSMWLDQRK